MFVVMVVIDTRNDYYHEEYSGIQHDNYMDAEYELYDAREEGLNGYIKEVE